MTISSAGHNPADLFSVILTHHSRPALAARHFPDAVQYSNPDRLLENRDILSPNFDLTWASRVPAGLIRVYNCFEGHLACLRLGVESGKPLIAVYEDDCTPTDWYRLCLGHCLDQWDAPANRLELLNFQGRGVGRIHRRAFAGYAAIAPLPLHHKRGLRWCCGALHYLITRAAAQRIVGWIWDGMPIDIRLANETRMVILDPSPVIHDRSQGSIIEGIAA